MAQEVLKPPIVPKVPIEARERLATDEARKKDSQRKTDSWALLRASTEFLNENADKWRQ